MRIDLGVGVLPATLFRRHSVGPTPPSGHLPVVFAGANIIHRGEPVVARTGG